MTLLEMVLLGVVASTVLLIVFLLSSRAMMVNDLKKLNDKVSKVLAQQGLDKVIKDSQAITQGSVGVRYNTRARNAKEELNNLFKAKGVDKATILGMSHGITEILNRNFGDK